MRRAETPLVQRVRDAVLAGIAPGPANADALQRLRADTAHTVFIRRLTLVAYVIAVFALQRFGVPLDSAILVILTLWLLSTFPLLGLVERARTVAAVNRIQSAYLSGELLLMLAVVHEIGGAGWIAILFPVFTVYYAAILLPALNASILIGATSLGFCALAVGEALGWISHHPVFQRSAADYREPLFLLATLVLGAVGGYGALGITFGRFGALQRRTAAAEQEQRVRAEALLTAAEALAAGSDTETLLLALARIAREALDADRAAVWVVDRETRTARRAALARGSADGGETAPASVRLDEPVIQQVLNSATPVVAHADNDEPASELARRFGVGVLMVAPIRRQQQVVGAVTVVDCHPSVRWGSNDLATVAAIAHQGSVALERAETASAVVEAEALRRVDRMRTDLFRTVGHELRRPLTVTTGYLELLLQQGAALPPDRLRGMLAEALANAREMAAQINDLTDIVHAEAGVLNLQRSAVDLRALIVGIGDAYRLLPGGERIVVQVAAAIPRAQVDPVRLRQAVGNLLSNALRYAPEGPIVLAGERVGDTIVISVTDQGPGIPEEEQPRIWDRYRRAGGAEDVAPGGMGIGLAVVRAVVSAHGGNVGLSSSPTGTCFRISIPLTLAAV